MADWADCIFPECNRRPRAQGLCGTHYKQKQRGEELKSIRSYKHTDGYSELCAYPDCGRPKDARGLCGTHYAQIRRGKRLTVIRKRWR